MENGMNPCFRKSFYKGREALVPKGAANRKRGEQAVSRGLEEKLPWE